MLDDKSAATTIDQNYLATSDADEETNRPRMDRISGICAHCLWERWYSSNNKGFGNIKSTLWSDFHVFTQCYERFDQYNDAARYYKVAAAETSDPTSHAKLLGRAVLAHAHAKAAAGVVAGAVDELKTYVQTNNVSEYELLIVLRQLAEIEKHEQAAIAFMQRVVELDPSDEDTRFALAFKHAEIGNDELALYHYLLIPFAQRTAATWNNLGVAFDKAKLPAKSVNAYQKAKDEGDTLAMSNLAFKCLTAGFLVEARALIDDALKRTNIHGNIPRALTQLEEQEANKSARLTKIIDKCSAANTFYNEFGAANASNPVARFVRSMERSRLRVRGRCRRSVLVYCKRTV